MGTRLVLHEVLFNIIVSRNVYYHPPESIKMNYPAIVYSRNDISNKYGDDIPYMQSVSYQVTVIDKDPDSTIVSDIAKLPYCRFNRHFTSDNLNHDVFTLYY